VGFHGHEFKVDSRALIPRHETEELVEWLVLHTKPAPAKVLDLGCGSGVIGLSLAAAWPDSQITLADVSKAALELAKENATALGLTNVSFVETSLFSSIHDTFDLIVANLPYVPEADRATLAPEVLHDPELALFSGSDGLDLIRQFCAEVKGFLQPSGMVSMEIGYDQSQITMDLLRAGGLDETSVMKDISGIARFPLAKRAHSSKPDASGATS
jgi:release factor glutamine methyltransferase